MVAPSFLVICVGLANQAPYFDHTMGVSMSGASRRYRYDVTAMVNNLQSA